jgi:hypothetical protein
VKKPIGALVAVTLALVACTTPEAPERDEIAALEGADGKAGAGDADKGRPESGEDANEKESPRQGDGGGGAETGGGGGTGSDADGGGASQPSGNAGSPGRKAQAAAPIPQGDYDYATNGERNVSGNEQPMPETTTLAAGAPSDGVQRQTRDLRDSDGNGVVTETDLVYRPDGVFLSYVKITSRFQGGLTDVREFRLPRPELIAPAGAGPGAARSFTMEGSGTRARVSIRAHRYQDVTVAGNAVRTLVVQTDIAFSGALEGNQRSMTWFWPRHLLPVREQVETDVRNGPIRLQSNYTATIRRLP